MIQVKPCINKSDPNLPPVWLELVGEQDFIVEKNFVVEKDEDLTPVMKVTWAIASETVSDAKAANLPLREKLIRSFEKMLIENGI